MPKFKCDIQSNHIPTQSSSKVIFTLQTVKVSKLAKNTKEYSARCLIITEKVSFNIAREASYVYILSGQKLIKNAKNGQFWRVFENLKLAVKQCYQTGQFLIGQKLVENAKIQKFKSTFWLIFKQCEQVNTYILWLVVLQMRLFK